MRLREFYSKLAFSGKASSIVTIFINFLKLDKEGKIVAEGIIFTIINLNKIWSQSRPEWEGFGPRGAAKRDQKRTQAQERPRDHRHHIVIP